MLERLDDLVNSSGCNCSRQVRYGIRDIWSRRVEGLLVACWYCANACSVMQNAHLGLQFHQVLFSSMNVCGHRRFGKGERYRDLYDVDWVELSWVG